MDELVKVNFDTQTVSARDLYDLLSKEDGVKVQNVLVNGLKDILGMDSYRA